MAFFKGFGIPKQSKQELVPFNFHQYENILNEADRVVLEDMKDEALSQTLTPAQTQDILRISSALAETASENNIPSSADDIDRFIKEFYQSRVAAEQVKNVEIDPVKYQTFVDMLEEVDKGVLQQIRTIYTQYGTLQLEDRNNVAHIKNHFVTAVKKGGHDFTAEEVDSYIDALITPIEKQPASTELDPIPTYRVERTQDSAELPPSRFDDPSIKPAEDLR